MHRTLLQCVRCGESARQHSPDARTVSLWRPVRCVRCSPRRALGHRTLRPSYGGHRQVVGSSVELSVFQSSATLRASGDPETGTYNPRLETFHGWFSLFPQTRVSPEPPKPNPSHRISPPRQFPPAILLPPCKICSKDLLPPFSSLRESSLAWI